MMTREEIRAVYDQGPEAVIARVEQLYALIAQQPEQIAQLQGRVKGLEDRLATTLARRYRRGRWPPRSMACAEALAESETRIKEGIKDRNVITALKSVFLGTSQLPAVAG